MRRARRLSVALLLVASLAAAHGAGGLAHTVADGDGSYCCCPSPDECRCTANCCSHGPSPAAQRDDARSGGPRLLSSVSCHFPRLPDGSLSGAAAPDLVKGVLCRDFREQAPPDPSTVRLDPAAAFEPADGSSQSSPRAPPVFLRVRC